MAVVLDTSFLVDLERKRARAAALLDELVEEDHALLIPSVVVAEYVAGSRSPTTAVRRLHEAGDVQPFAVEDALVAGIIAADLFAKRAFPGWTDVLIAGFARARGELAIVTGNARNFPASPVRTY